MRRTTYVVPRTNAIYIAVSKAANTTLKYLLHGPTITLDMLNAGARLHSYDRMLTRLVDTGRTLNDLMDGQERIFAFVRHPTERFWSAYFSKVFNHPDHAIVQAVARHFGVPPRPDFPPEMILDYVEATAPVNLDDHIRPQWSSIGFGRLPINYLGRVESMADDLQRLVSIGYLDANHLARFSHLNRSERTAVPNKREIDRRVEAVYQRDFELLGYD